MKFIVSNNGSGIAVGLVGDADEAERLVILAENLYNANHSDEYFTRLLYLPSLKKLKHLLVMREYYNQWDKYWDSVNHYKISEDETDKIFMLPHRVYKFTKAAILTVNEIIRNNVCMENFMQNISHSNQTYSIGTIYTDTEDEDDY